MSSSPYDPPIAEPLSQRKETKAENSLFLTWEKLRIAYNLVLVVVVVIESIALGRNLFDPGYFESLILGAIGANILYCLGPVVDGYAGLLGLRHRLVTGLIFGLGLFVAIGLAMGSVLFYGWKFD